MNALTKPILEEIKDLITEGEFNAKLELLVAYHRAGELIIESGLPNATIASYIHRSVRLVEYMAKFAKRFPSVKNIPEIPEGKHIGWTGVIEKYLTTPQEKAEHIHDFKSRCWCGAIK